MTSQLSSISTMNINPLIKIFSQLLRPQNVVHILSFEVATVTTIIVLMFQSKEISQGGMLSLRLQTYRR